MLLGKEIIEEKLYKDKMFMNQHTLSIVMDGSIIKSLFIKQILNPHLFLLHQVAHNYIQPYYG